MTLKIVDNEMYFTQNQNFKDIIKRFFPDAKNFKKITTAWTNFVFEAEIKKETFIFRFPRNQFFAEALMKEVSFNNQFSNQLNIETNHLHLFKIDGKIFSMHKKIEGECLSQLATSLSENEMADFSKQICKIIFDFQSLKLNSFKLPFLSDFLSSLAFVNKENNFDFSKLCLLRQLEEICPVFCHGDLNPGNIIIQNGKITGIIDFAFVGISSPLIDLSRLIGRLPERFHPHIIDACNKRGIFINTNELNFLIGLWQDVETNYIDYIKKNCPDIVLPSPF